MDTANHDAAVRRDAGQIDAGQIDAAAIALRSFSPRYVPKRIDLPPDGPGFSGAIVFKVETGAGPFGLRGWPVLRTNAERVRGQHRLVADLRRRGIDYVAEPVASIVEAGATLIWSGGRWWHLEPWLAGRADFWSQPGDRRLVAAAVALARLHRAAAQFAPTVAEARWLATGGEGTPPAVVDRIARFENWTAERLAQLQPLIAASESQDPEFARVAGGILAAFMRCAPGAARALRSTETLRVPLHPVLRDVWHDHILFTGDDVSGIVDLAAIRADTVAADLARLLGSLVGDDRPRWETALAAYQTVRPLSADERRLVDLLDRSGLLLSGMTWLARRYFDSDAFAQPQRVLARMRAIAARLELLVQSGP